MTAKADFNAEEWETLLEAPPAAGLLVVLSDRGGSIKETFSMAKAYTEAASSTAPASCWTTSSPRSPRSTASARAHPRN